MANAVKIKQTMVEQGIPEEVIMQFEFPDSYKNHRPEPIIPLINQMDRLLSKEQCLSIMEQQGCCKTGKPDVAWRAFGRKHANKTVEEKLELLAELDTPHKAPCHLNSDGTLSVYWGFEHDGRYHCVCSAIKNLPQPVNISHTYCGCCGGHIRHHYQNGLGVRLRLKEVVSSPISSGGEKRCEFLFEILK